MQAGSLKSPTKVCGDVFLIREGDGRSCLSAPSDLPFPAYLNVNCEAKRKAIAAEQKCSRDGYVGNFTI